MARDSMRTGCQALPLHRHCPITCRLVELSHCHHTSPVTSVLPVVGWVVPVAALVDVMMLLRPLALFIAATAAV